MPIRNVFLKIRESGLKLNKTKCQIRKQLIVFLGHIVSEGIKIDPSKTEAITKMPLPGLQLMSYKDFLVWIIT